MSQQERGRGRGVGGHGQMRGRGVYHSPSPRPLRPEYQNFEGHPGSGYHPPQYSSGGMHSDHPGSRYPPPQYSPSPIHSGHPESSYHPPQYSAHPYQNIPTSTFPPHYQQQSVISVAVIQSTPQPAPVPQQAPPDQYYSDRHPMQSPASYFQPNQSDHLPPKHGDYIGQNIGHEPYSRDNIFLPSQQYQKPFPARDHGAYSEDHFRETGGSHFRPPRSSSAGFSQPFKTKQEHDHRGSQEKYVSGQQAYDHPTGQKKQYGPPKQGHIRASKQKFPGSQQGHDTSQVKIGTQQKQDLHTGQKHQGSQQKSDNYMRQRSAHSQEPPPSYESLSFASSNEHRKETPFVPHSKGTEHKAGQKKPRAGKPNEKSTDILQPKLDSTGNNTGVAGNNFQKARHNKHVHQVRKDSSELSGNSFSSKQNQSSSVPKDLPYGTSKERQRPKQKSSVPKVDRPDVCEGFIPDSTEIKKEKLKAKKAFKPKLSAKANLDRDLSSISAEEKDVLAGTGDGRKKNEKGNFPRKSQNAKRNSQSNQGNQMNTDKTTSLEKTVRDKTDDLVTVENENKSEEAIELNKQGVEFARKQRSRNKNKRKKANKKSLLADPELQQEEPAACYITKASLQIWAPFKDADNLKETVQLYMNKAKILHFVDDSIICSEKRGVCTVVIKTINFHIGKYAIRSLCERIKNGLNTNVTFDISSGGQEQSVQNACSQSIISPVTSSQQTAGQQLLDTAKVTTNINEKTETGKNEISDVLNTVSTVGSSIDNENNEGNIELQDDEGKIYAKEEGSECIEEEDSEYTDEENSERQDEDNSESEDDDNSESEDDDNNEIEDKDNREGDGESLDEESNESSFDDNSECSDEENNEGTDEENSDGTDEEKSLGIDEEGNVATYEEENVATYEEGNEGTNEEGNDSTNKDIKGLAEVNIAGLQEENNECLYNEAVESLGEVKKVELSQEDSASVNTNIVQNAIKLSVVVDRIFPLKTDFLEFISKIFGDNMSVLELLPNSVVMATSTTLCEFLAPSKLDAKNIVKIANSSSLEGVKVRCFIVNYGLDLK